MITNITQFSLVAAKGYKACVAVACTFMRKMVNVLDEAMAKAIADPHQERVAKAWLPVSIKAQRKAAYGRLKRGRRIT